MSDLTTTISLNDVADIKYDDSRGLLDLTTTSGVFYEWKVAKFLGGHAVLGPNLEYDVIFAPSIEQNAATLSLRAVFYGGP